MKKISPNQSFTKNVDKYFEHVKIIIRCLGFRSVYISDDSKISDFISFLAKKKDVKNTIQKLEKKIRIKVNSKDCVWKVARKIYKKEKLNEQRKAKL